MAVRADQGVRAVADQGALGVEAQAALGDLAVAGRGAQGQIRAHPPEGSIAHGDVSYS